MDEFLTRLRRALHLPDGTEPTDAQLLARYVEHREDAAFAALVQRHGPMVFGVCRRALAVPDAEDAFQATFLVLMRRAASVVPREQLAAWLYGVARRTALKARERAQRRFARERTVAELPDVGAPADPREDAHVVIDEELERLPSKYRAPVVLCDVEGLTREEAARQLGWVVGTLSWRLAAARKLLADRLSRRGVGLSAVALASGALAPPACAGSHSPEVIELAREVLSDMTSTKIRFAVGALCVALAAGLGAAVFAMPPDAPKVAAPVPPAKEAREPKLRATLDNTTLVLAVAYNADGKRIATAGGHGPRGKDGKDTLPVRVWDTATNKVVRAFDHSDDEPIFLMKFAPDGKLFLGAWLPSLWDADTGKVVARFKNHKNVVASVTFAPDGKTLATGAADGSARVWDAATGKQLAYVPFGTSSVAYAPDGKTLAFVGGRGQVRLWDLAAHKESGMITPPLGTATKLAISPDGKRIAYTEYVARKGDDQSESSIRVVDFAGKEHLRIRGHRFLSEVAFSPCGSFLLSTGFDSSVRLWDANTGESLAVFTEKTPVEDSFAFSPDGNTLALGADKQVKLWDISSLRKKKK